VRYVDESEIQAADLRSFSIWIRPRMWRGNQYEESKVMEHLKISEAQRVIFESVKVLDTEQVPLEQSLGACWHRTSWPTATCRLMTCRRWTALRCAAATWRIPATFEIIEDIKAGDMPNMTVPPSSAHAS